MFFNVDIDNYLLDFLPIPQLVIYPVLSKSFYNVFKQSKYYREIMLCKEKYKILSIDNICKCNFINLFKKYIRYQNNYDHIFQLVATNGNLKATKLLAYRYNNIVKNNNHVIRKVASRGYLNIIKYLIFQDLTIMDDIFIARYASKNNHLELLKFLFFQDSNVKIYNSFSIKWAFGDGSVETLSFLISQGLKLPDYIFTLMCKQGYLKIVKFLSFHFDVLINNYNILQVSTKHGHLDIIKFLIYQGLNDKNDISIALNYAAERGFSEIVKYLISEGAESTTNDNYAIQQAARNGHSTIVCFLMFHNVNLFVNDNFSVRYAYVHGYSKIAQFLISQGADLFACNNFVIRYISEFNCLDLFKLIILYDADITYIINYTLRTVISKGYMGIVRFLSYYVDLRSINDLIYIALDYDHKNIIYFLIYQGIKFK